MSILLFLIILTVLVFVHELGHFLVAKRFGIRVDEFGFGFPPRVFGIRKGETLYSLNLIPFGGFVKIFGENPDAESLTGPDSQRSFVRKPRYVQAAVLVAGIAANLLLAWLLLSAGFMSGLPSSVEPGTEGASLVVTSVLPDSPAEAAGLSVGDRILRLESGDEAVESPAPSDVQAFVREHGQEEITVSYARSGEEESVAVTPASGISDQPAIGISMDLIGTLRLPVHKALIEGGRLTALMTKETVVSLFRLIGDAFRGTADLSTITGPVGLVGPVGDAYRFGFAYLLSFAALISINLAVINLMPFPALDGGRLLFVGIEAIKGSPIRPRIANAANAIGFILLIGLMLVITFNDVMRLL